MNMFAHDRGESLWGLSLSQFTYAHMEVKKCSEGYFVSNLGQGATLAWLYEHATLRDAKALRDFPSASLH
jgi:hypothetical protein